MNNFEQIITLGRSLIFRPIIACIGSTKDLGDSLGPLVGTLLEEKYKTNAIVIGTLLSPLHALNLTERIPSTIEEYPQSKVIAVDACAISENKDCIRIIKGGIKPGLASGKDLPRIGDYSIVGSAYKFGGTTHCLGKIYALADKIAKLINFLTSLSSSTFTQSNL